MFSPTPSYLLTVMGVAALYLVTGWLGTRLSYSPDSVTLIWPPAGIALAAGLLFGYRVWPGILLGEVGVLLANHISLPVSLSVSAGNAGAMVVGVWLLQRVRFDARFERVRDVLSLVVLAGVVATMMSATIGSLSMALGGVVAWGSYFPTWIKWWLGDAMGVMLVAPALLVCCSGAMRSLWYRPKLIELFALGLLAVTSGVSFGGWLGMNYLNLPLAFLPFPCLVWIAMTMDMRGVAIAVLMLSIIAVVGTVLELGPFIRPDVNESLALVWGFLATSGLTPMLLNAVEAERRRSVMALRRNEHSTRAVLNSLNAHVVVLDGNGVIVAENEAWRRFVVDNAASGSGWCRSEKNYFDIWRRVSAGRNSTETSAYLIGMRAVLAGKATEFEQEYRCASAAGERWFSLRAAPLRQESGGLVISHIDITRLKRAEGALRESEEKYRLLFEKARDAIVAMDKDGKVLAANPAAAVMVGYAGQDQLVGQSAISFFADPAQRDALLRELRAKGYADNVEMTLVRRGDGSNSLIHVLGSATLQRDEKQALQRVEAILTDVSKYKQASEELKQAKESAEQANAAKSRFLAAASHDLRQPLQTLSLLTEVLAKQAKDQGTLEITRQLGEALNAVRYLLDALLDVSKLEAGVVNPRVREFPVADLLDRMRKSFNQQAAELGVALHVVRCSAVIRSDDVLLGRIVQNFLANALRHSQGNKVLLGCRRRGNTLRIEVWDDGIGIPEAQRKAIFEEFYQLDNFARDRRKGLGLGLTIVERTAHLLAHAIEVRSEPEKGSMFAVVVPRGSRSQHVDRVTSLPSADLVKGALILVIDDEPAVAMSLQLLLTLSGFQVITAATGREALERLQSENVRPDLVISDYRLPEGASGVQIIRSIREYLGSEVAAILLTGDTSPGQVGATQRSGLEVLYKPVEADKLLASINRSLTRQACRGDLDPPKEVLQPFL